jgi:hypothetical protein
MFDHGCLGSNKESFPLSQRILITILLPKMFLNKDIEMSYDILYRQEKLANTEPLQNKPNLATAV